MSPTQPLLSRQPGQIELTSRLACGSALPSEYPSTESRQSTSTTGTARTTNTTVTTSTLITSPSDCEGGPRSPALRVSSFSPSIPPAPRSPSSIVPTVAQPAKSKKKSSLLGTLFAKEPSTDAFLQMQNQSRKEMAQTPGRKNPPGMSGVSSAKMPENVPKVNSKWDGMPCMATGDSDRPASRSDSRRTSRRTSSTRPRSARSGSNQSHGRQRSDSTTKSRPLDQRRPGTSAQLDVKRNVPGGLESVAESLSSGNSTMHPRSKSVSIVTQSLRSPSGSSLPQITSFFPCDIPDPPGVPQIYKGLTSSRDSSRVSPQGRVERDDPESAEPGVDPSDHASSSSVAAPQRSPITPLSELISLQRLDAPIARIHYSMPSPAAEAKRGEVVRRPPGSDVLRVPEANAKISGGSARAFLAGEAHPLRLPNEEQGLPKKNAREGVFAPVFHIQDLERRPDSSRARLGLRASIIRSVDAAPWEWHKETDLQSDALSRAPSPRNRFSKSFGVFAKA